MIPVLIVALFVWASVGAFTSARALFTSDAAPAMAGVSAGMAVPTFAQRRRATYRAWRDRLRRGLPGRRGGGRLAEMFSDATAATLAGIALFTTGFAAGAGWAFSVRTGRGAGARPAAGASRRGPDRGRRSGRGTGPNPGPSGPGRPAPPPRPEVGEGIVEVELLDDDTTPDTPRTHTWDGAIDDAEIIPDATATAPTVIDTTRENTPMAEILNIHALLDFAAGAAHTAANAIEESGIRAHAALARAEKATIVAATAAQQAASMEQAIAHFASLGIDAASLAAMQAMFEAAVNLAAAEAARAEAEHAAAEAAQRAAAAAEMYGAAAVEAHGVVQARQMPHADAQEITGNAAAHTSLLERT